MELTAKPSTKGRGNIHRLYDDALRNDRLKATGAGIEIGFTTRSIAMTGRFRAVLALTYEEIEALAAMASSVSMEQRLAMATEQVAMLKEKIARDERFESSLPTEGEG